MSKPWTLERKARRAMRRAVRPFRRVWFSVRDRLREICRGMAWARAAILGRAFRRALDRARALDPLNDAAMVAWTMAKVNANRD